MKITSTILMCLLAAIAGFYAAQPTLNAVEDKTAIDRTREDFELMRLFAEAYEQIDLSYVGDVDRRDLVEAAIQGMATHLDPYSSYIAPRNVRQFDRFIDQEFGGIGIHVNGTGGKLEILSVLPGTPAFRAGLKAGDEIVEVDAKSTKGLTQAALTERLIGPSGRPVELGIVRAGSAATEHISVVRETIQIPTVVGMQRNPDQTWNYWLDAASKLGYLRITHFTKHTPEELQLVMETLTMSELKGVVVDLRSNPGGLLTAAIEISDMFLESGKIVSVKGRAVPERSWQAKPGNTFPAIPVAVLVNRYSASASEVLSAALQDNSRAVIIGERTFGKGSVQTVLRLESGKSLLKLTTANYYRPNGVNIHRTEDMRPEDDWGVQPTDGHAHRMSKEQWKSWHSARDAVDYGLAAPEPAFEDPHLVDAIDWLTKEQATEPATE
ncbi:MAG: S41 family peptidase [Planctomycetaceae bacterium]|nr:S41 family peptidase [Planctomycetaceae bacterium]